MRMKILCQSCGGWGDHGHEDEERAFICYACGGTGQSLASQDQWWAEANLCLLKSYGITVDDAGWERSEFLRVWGDDTPQHAITQFALKYDLEARS